MIPKKQKMKKPFFQTSSTEYMNVKDVPGEYRKELDAIMDTVETIHGERGKPITQHSKFLINMKSLMGLMVTNADLKEEVDEDKFKKVLVTIATQLASSHSDALKLTDEEEIAAMNASSAVDNIVRHLSKARNEGEV